MNKVLIVTYYWPPSGGAGVQRWLKFAKYLPEYGWEPVILTVEPACAAYPVTDKSLDDDLPASLKVYKTPATDYFSIYKKDRSKIPSAGFANSADNSLKGKILRFIRGNFFIPDPRKGWNKFAFLKACELIESKEIKYVITTSPPHSSQLIGLKIKEKYPQIKWIADLRDPWTDIYYYDQFYPTPLSKWIDSGFEKKVLENADRVITVGESLKKLFATKVSEAEIRTTVITNGYDEDDFRRVTACEPPIFTLTYTGTLSDIYPLKGLLASLKILQSEGTDFLIRFVGSVSSDSKKLIKSYLSDRQAEFLPYAKHDEAIQHMVDSSMLVLIIPSHKSNNSIITGKLFEYLGSGKPVLCLGPTDGDASAIIEKCLGGRTFDYDNSDAIVSFIRDIMNNKFVVQNSAGMKFSRRNLTRLLAEAIL
jgi:glycosyltransferase involved in cell wall biosynthesis